MTGPIIAYRLVPVYEPVGFSIATAAVMSCMATGEVLSGSGGGGEFLSPTVVDTIRERDGKPMVILPTAWARALRSAANSYAEDLVSGLEDGTYDDDAGLEELEQVLDCTLRLVE